MDQKKGCHVSQGECVIHEWVEKCVIHEWVEKGAVMYPVRSVEYMIGSKKEQSCIPGGVRDT